MTEKNNIPLDQQNRDWSKGNCYYVALELLKDFPILVNEGVFPSDAEVHLVHGTIGEDRIQHAWVEYGNMLIDHSNNQSIHCLIQNYYSENKAKLNRKFTREEADAILSSIELPEGGFGSLNWSEITDAELQECLKSYAPATSPFTRRIVFSNPDDSANKDNLILPNTSND